MMKQLLLITLMVLFSVNVFSQDIQKRGRFSGSFEMNNALYQKDMAISPYDPENSSGWNNYLQISYTYGRFQAGLQYEAYLPPLAGFTDELKGQKLIQGFIKYTKKNTEIILGNFYEQFGSGLIFRSYEERSLGVNNSIIGIAARFKPIKSVSLKLFTGKPRYYLTYSNTVMSGADAEISLAQLFGHADSDWNTKFGLSYVRQQNEEIKFVNYPTNIDAYAGRINIDKGIFNFSSEYVYRTAAQVYFPSFGFFRMKGSAFLINTGFNQTGFGINISLRKLENMNTRADNRITFDPVYTNYIPALTRQHKYALANIYPYNVQANGEIGGQADIYWQPQSSFLGGSYPEKISLNFSSYYSLDHNIFPDEYSFLYIGNQLLYNDINLEFEKKWCKKMKTNIMLMLQKIDGLAAGKYGPAFGSQIIVIDNLYRITPKKSVRFELQHMWSEGAEGNWAYGSVEVGIAPRWMFYLSDMYNYGVPYNAHYYNAGLSYSKSIIRTALAYGRNRGGYQCSGGICRYMPATSGLNFQLTVSF